MAAVERKPRATPGNTNGRGTAGKPKGPKLTRKLGAEICERISKGVPASAASLASGVSSNTIFEWRRRGRGEDDRPQTPLTEWFAAEYDRALASCHAGLVVELREGAKTEPRLLMFMLERRFPDEWGRREIKRYEGVVDHTVRVELAFDATPDPIGDGYPRQGGKPVRQIHEVALDPDLIDVDDAEEIS